MAKYKLKALSLLLGGKLYLIENNDILDEKNYDKDEFKSALDRNFLVKIDEKAAKVVEAPIEEAPIEEAKVVDAKATTKNNK